MKKSKLITSICATVGVIAPIITLSSCSCHIGGGDTPVPPVPPTPTERIKCNGSKKQGTSIEKEAIYTFKYQGTDNTPIHIALDYYEKQASHEIELTSDSVYVTNQTFTVGVRFKEDVKKDWQQTFKLVFTYKDVKDSKQNIQTISDFSIYEENDPEQQINISPVGEQIYTIEANRITEYTVDFQFELDSSIPDEYHKLFFRAVDVEKSESTDIEILPYEFETRLLNNVREKQTVKLPIKIKNDGGLKTGDFANFKIECEGINTRTEETFVQKTTFDGYRILNVNQDIELDSRPNYSTGANTNAYFVFDLNRPLKQSETLTVSLSKKTSKPESLTVPASIEPQINGTQVILEVPFEYGSDRISDTDYINFSTTIKCNDGSKTIFEKTEDLRINNNYQGIKEDGFDTTIKINDLTNDKQVDFTFELDDKLQDGDTLTCQIKQSQEEKIKVTLGEFEAHPTGTSIVVPLLIAGGTYNNNDSGNFDLEFINTDSQGKIIFSKTISDCNIIYEEVEKPIPPEYLMIDGSTFLGLKDTDQLLGFDTLVIPSSVTETASQDIGVEGSSLMNIKTIRFEDSDDDNLPLTINADSFKHFNYVEKVVLPSRLSYLAASAFRGLYHLKYVDVTAFHDEDFNESNPFYESDVFQTDVSDGQVFYQSDAKLNAYFSLISTGIPTDWFIHLGTPKYEDYGDYKYVKMKGIDETILVGLSDSFTPKSSELYLPYDASIIARSAFKHEFTSDENAGINKIVLPKESNIKNIYLAAFAENTSLQNVELLGESLNAIGVAAFRECTSLKTITLGGNVDLLGSWCFWKCSSLEETDIEANENITKIPLACFLECPSLKKLPLKNISWISAQAFNGCSVDSINIPSNVHFIGYRSFAQSTTNTITLNNGLIYIDQFAFADNINVESINIPQSVTNIGGGCFNGMSKLTSITVDSNNSTFFVIKDEDGGDYLYEDGNKLISVDADFKDFNLIPNATYRIGNDVFYNFNNTNMEEVDLSHLQALNSIEPYAFNNMVVKRKAPVILPPSIKKIQNHAFDGCTSIGSVNFKELTGLEEILPYAFEKCINLELVEFSSIKHIWPYAFSNCKNIKTVVFPNGIEHIDIYAFYALSYIHTIDVSAIADTIYINDNVWDKNAFYLTMITTDKNEFIIHDESLYNNWRTIRNVQSLMTKWKFEITYPK